jgi:nitrogen fixation protein FixH
MKTGIAPSLTGRHVLFILIGFFAVIFAVNGLFVYYAESSFSGLETTNPFVKGIDYNEEIAAAKAQQKLGWPVSLEQTAGVLMAEYKTRGNQPLDGLAVTAKITRAATDRYDQSLSLKGMGRGHYSVNFAPSLKGQWLVRLEASDADNNHFILDQTLIVN